MIVSTHYTTLINAAAMLLYDGELEGPDKDEYTRALCELIADAGGGSGDKYAVWADVQNRVYALRLPTEPGLYQAGDPYVPVEHAVTFRLNDVVGWVNALDNKPADLRMLAGIQRAHGLARLTRLAPKF